MQVQHLPLASLNLLGLARTRPPSRSQCLCQKPLPSPQSCPAAAAHQRIRPRLLLPTHEAQGPTGAQGHLSTEKPPGFTHRCPRKTPTLTLQRQNPAGPSRPLRAHAPSSPTDPAPPTPSRGPRTQHRAAPRLPPLTVSPAANAAQTSQRSRGGSDPREPHPGAPMPPGKWSLGPCTRRDSAPAQDTLPALPHRPLAAECRERGGSSGGRQSCWAGALMRLWKRAAGVSRHNNLLCPLQQPAQVHGGCGKAVREA